MGCRSGRRYWRDLRDGVVAAVDGGMSVRRAAATFGVSPAYIYKALMGRRLTGESGPNPKRGHAPRKLTASQEMALAEHMRSPPAITLVMAQGWLEAEHGVSPPTGAVWNPARTVDGLVDLVGDVIDRFLPTECANVFNASGYQRSM